MYMATKTTTSIEYWCIDTVHQILRTMARERRFSAVGNDQMQSLNEQSVIKRFNRRPRASERGQESPERSLDTPGIIVTYLGHRLPASAGENSVDDGVVKILVQIVNAGEDGDFTNGESYLNWMASIRKALQGSPDKPSPLEKCPLTVGQVYLVHVTELNPPDETDWGFAEHMRIALSVDIFTRTNRTNR